MSYPYTVLYLDALHAKQRIVRFFELGSDQHVDGLSVPITKKQSEVAVNRHRPSPEITHSRNGSADRRTPTVAEAIWHESFVMKANLELDNGSAQTGDRFVALHEIFDVGTIHYFEECGV